MIKKDRCGRCGKVFTNSKALQNHKKANHKSSYWLLRIIPIIIIITIVYIGITQINTQVENDPTIMINQNRAPDFTLPIINENGISQEMFNLHSNTGKIVLLEFMVSWCGHCENMVEPIRDLYNEYNNEVIIVSIAGAYNSSEGKTSEFIREHNATWTHVFDVNEEAFQNYEIESTPTFIIINHKGEIFSRTTGEQSTEMLKKYLDDAIDQASNE